MTDELNQILNNDEDGLLIYQYIANNVDCSAEDMALLIENLKRVDRKGQFSASAARYLNTIGDDALKPVIDELIDHVIDADRERRYIAELLPDIYGADYVERAEELSLADRNFRRMYKRVYPSGF